MSISRWIGKKIISLQNKAREEEIRATDHVYSKSRMLDQLIAENSSMIVAFPITNGYLIRGVSGSLTYCKTGAEIGEHIVVADTKQKLGLKPQGYTNEAASSSGF